MASGDETHERTMAIFRDVVSDAIAGRSDEVREAFSELMKSRTTYVEAYFRAQQTIEQLKVKLSVPCGLRHVLLQLAATRDPLEVPAAEREPWMVNRMQFLAAEARRVLGLTRVEARAAICGAQLPTDC